MAVIYLEWIMSILVRAMSLFLMILKLILRLVKSQSSKHPCICTRPRHMTEGPGCKVLYLLPKWVLSIFYDGELCSFEANHSIFLLLCLKVPVFQLKPASMPQ